MIALFSRSLNASSYLKLPPPIFAGGTGGSGTRAIAQMLQCAGYAIGRTNEMLDAKAFTDFCGKWLPDYLSSGCGTTMPKHRIYEMEADLWMTLDRLRGKGASRTMLWGGKAPRLLLLLPFLDRMLPQMKFVHLVRDGRDMAFSTNQNQLREYGNIVLEGRDHMTDAEASALFWSRTNLQAADYGEKNMPRRYLLLRYEDVCLRAQEAASQVFGFLGCNDTARANEAAAAVRASAKIGRWQKQDPEEIQRVLKAAEPGLRRFGYTS